MDFWASLATALLLKAVESAIAEETKRQEEAHRQRIAWQTYLEHARMAAREAERQRQIRAMLERARQASTDAEWQKTLDLLQATMNTPHPQRYGRAF